jgi:hypothetical protein
MAVLRQALGAFLVLVVLGVAVARAQDGKGQIEPAKAEQLFAMANEARSETGVGRLSWDPALAAAALKHCQRMVAEGPISHRYGGELDLAERAGASGAHFSLIEENIAVGPYPATIHQGWLESPGHRANLLNRDVDRVGVAVVASRGELFAVEDFARDVPTMTPAQAEAAIAGLVRVSGVSIGNDSKVARAACVLDRGLPGGVAGDQPQFVMRWQDADLSHLPHALEERLASGQYRRASVGNCPVRSAEGAFTAYRFAVLLY